MSKTGTVWILGGGLILLVGVFAFASLVSEKPKTTRELAVLCSPTMSEVFHIHPTLEIVINGANVVVPANIGITPTCMTALHTHTADGIIHVEAPEKRDFTIGDFFAVWDKLFTKEQIFEYKADASHRVTIQVNGTVVDTYEQTVLKDGDHILITYGK
ncbi:MAG TPA: hypothetical protein VM103_02050 [Candidatus Paceibacterota bacterium]|nr:hypothetical protein [Candidatus Paceibacterota bacterium]